MTNTLTQFTITEQATGYWRVARPTVGGGPASGSITASSRRC